MKLEFDVYRAICETKRFVINGIKATYKDFGEKYDAAPDKTRPNCCGNMLFEPKVPAQQILDKYGITISEYMNICKQLQDCVSFGTCSLCE